MLPWLTLVLPKLSLAGVDLRALRKVRVRPLIGPVYAKDLPAYGHYFITAADTILDEPTEQAVKAHMPGVRVAGPLPGHASLLSWANARAAFGWEPERSWRRS